MKKIILTDAKAKSPTPLPKKTPSKTVFKDAIHIASADGIAYCKKLLTILYNLLSHSHILNYKVWLRAFYSKIGRAHV